MEGAKLSETKWGGGSSVTNSFVTISYTPQNTDIEAQRQESSNTQQRLLCGGIKS